MEKYKVVVVGAGPAGSAAGYVLARAGINVLIVDKENFPRKKLCGGLITEKTVRLIKEIYGEVDFEKIIDSTYAASGFYYKSEKVSVVDHPEKPVYMVDRYVFDDYFFRKAMDAGCKFLVGKVESAIKKDEKYEIEIENRGCINCNYLIGADGANSVVRKIITQRISKKEYAIAIEVDMRYEELACFENNQIFPQVYFGIMNFGYGWVFPKKDKVVIGVGGLVSKNKENLLEIFHRFAKQITKTGVAIEKNRILGFPVAFFNLIKNPSRDKLFLVGDAAGLVEPITGEGIYFAMLSGKLVSEAILNNDDYNKKINREIIRFLKQGYWAKKVFFNASLLKIAMKIMKRNRKYSEHYFSLLSGDVDYFGYIKKLLK